MIKQLKFKPYQGENLEIFEGNKTIVSLYENRFTYKIKFTQKVKIELVGEDPFPREIKEVNTYCDEKGFIMKDNVSGISSYIDTQFGERGEPYNIQKVDIAYGGTILTLTFSSEEDKDNIYNELDNWKNNSDGN